MLSTLIARLFGRHIDPAPRSLRRTQRRGQRRPSIVFEALEGRLLLSATLIGIPDWVDQGPSISINGQTAGLAGPNPVSGAIEAIAAEPGDANTILVGTVAGGIWRTTDAGVNWTPLTDQWPSLSFGAIEYSPIDLTNNTLFAGTGSFSSGGNGGPAVGGLRSTDGGNSWVGIGAEFTGQAVRSIVPAGGTSLADQVVLVATTSGAGGVWRSGNGGATFTRVSGSLAPALDGLNNDGDATTDEVGELNLPNTSASHIARDPTNANRFYASVPNNGVYRTDNSGLNWVQVNGTGVNLLAGAGAASRIEVSVSANGGVAYAGLISAGALTGVFRSTDQGANWAALGVPAPTIHPGGQAGVHFSILADNVANDVVYVGGDRQGGAPFVGNLFRNNAGAWAPIVLGGAGGTAPHADSRDMVFDANGNILQSDDGGIYRLVNPNAGGTAWQAFPTLPRVAQFITNVDYDRLNNAIIGGTQDTGSPEQATGQTWRDTSQADGGFTAVDNDQVAHPGTTLHYSSFQFFGGFTRTTINAANVPGASDGVNLTVTGAGGSVLTKNVNIGGNRTNTFDATLPFLPPFVLNRIDPDRMLIGTSFLFESTDGGENLLSLGGLNNLTGNLIDDDQDGGVDEGDEFTPAGALGGITAMAYGGRFNGADAADVTYVASGATLRLRTANSTNSTADFSVVTGYAGGAIRDIELDPDDWHRGYVLDTSGSVFSFVNNGASTTWANVTGGLAGQSGDIRDVELFTETAAPGDDILLVSGFGGVFRTLSPSATSVWSEYGANLPNLVVTDLVYDAADDVLVAGTYGRGAWKVSSVASTIDTLGVLQIYGDDVFSGQDDTIRLIRNAANPSLLDVTINTSFFQFQLSTIQQINVDSLGGKDTLIVDSTNGLITVQNGIRYDGGAGSDALQLLDTGAVQRTSDTYSVGPGLGQGLSVIVGAGTAGTQTVNFDNLEPVLDLVPAALLTVNATGGDNAINFTQGGLATNGKVSIDAFETIEFSNKVALVINALAGADAVGINNGATPTGLTSITVNGGDPGVGDSLSLTSTGAAVSVNTGLASITGATGAGGAVSVNYSGIEALALGGAIGTLSFTTTAADDALSVTPGASGAANSGTLVASGVAPSISFSNNGAITANLGAGNDSATVNGTTLADTFAVASTAVVITGRNAVNLTGAESVIVNGGVGSDTFNVTPAILTAFFIDGGDPISGVPGDLLAIAAGGQTVTYNAGPQTDEGSFGVGGNAAISFDHIESFAINGSGPAVINGTNGPDSITVIARDVSTHPGTNGIQDFTVSVNSGPELLFINVTSLTVNALAGSDEVALTTPAPNGAVWDVDVAINGGEPTAVGDRLVVSTPGAGAEIAVYTPNAADGGVLDLTSLSSPVVISQIETLVYDGQNDGDTLTVLGTGGADVLVHSPGATDQAGTLAVNALLAISYQNLSAALAPGLVRADGLGDADTLVLNGTALNDSFSVDAAALVSLNARVKVEAVSIETLTLEGLAGDDVFTLLPEMALSPFAVINFNGGAQASALGDRMVLVGGGGADAFQITGQTVILGTKVVNGSGVERTSLDAKGGANSIIYNGVLGTSEAITFASSGVVGGGQLSVPGVTQVDFSNVQTLEAVGNVPGSTETDTLAFTGTNAVDVFTINMAALGTDADPFLKLLPATGSAPLLTLRNYSNFETLRINGLDGADTFNVYTSDAGIDRAILIDGGSPTAKKKSTDNLNVYYTPSRPRIIHSAATQNPGSGLVDVGYTNRRFLIQYADMEQIVIARGVKP